MMDFSQGIEETKKITAKSLTPELNRHVLLISITNSEYNLNKEYFEKISSLLKKFRLRHLI